MAIHSQIPAAGSDPKRRKPAWLVLSLGFGGLLICILGAAVGAVVMLDRVRNEEARARKAFIERLGALDQIRGLIYLSGTYVRDLLLSPNSSAAAAEIARLTVLERDTQTALQRYSSRLEPDERVPFRDLRAAIEAYWRVLDAMRQWTPQERTTRRDSFFYDELVPRRTTMLQIADRIAAVNERGLGRAEEQFAYSAGNLRRSLLLTFAITLGGGIVLALVTITLILRLERELEKRRADSQELSARLLRAQENERRSLARELHDEIGQSLSAILMETDGAEGADGQVETRQHLDSIRRLAEKTVNEVRDLALLLRPSMLDDLGLIPALNWHARETTKRTGLRVGVSAEGVTDDLPEEHKTCIYRLIQEAVNNSGRHAKANAVEVAVRRERDRVLCTVQDDGAGFDAHFVRGLGLLGMEERVRRLGGHLEIDSKPGQGTLIKAELPIAGLVRKNGHDSNSHPVG